MPHKTKKTKLNISLLKKIAPIQFTIQFKFNHKKIVASLLTKSNSTQTKRKIRIDVLIILVRHFPYQQTTIIEDPCVQNSKFPHFNESDPHA